MKKPAAAAIGRTVVAYAQKLAEGDGRSRLYLKVWGERPQGRGLLQALPVSARPAPPPVEVLPGVTLDLTTWEKLWR